VPDDTTDEAELPPGVGLDVTVDADGEGFPADERRRLFLRQIADELRGDSSESRQLAAILYRVSDLYDPDEDTSPEETIRSAHSERSDRSTPNDQIGPLRAIRSAHSERSDRPTPNDQIGPLRTTRSAHSERSVEVDPREQSADDTVVGRPNLFPLGNDRRIARLDGRDGRREPVDPGGLPAGVRERLVQRPSEVAPVVGAGGDPGAPSAGTVVFVHAEREPVVRPRGRQDEFLGTTRPLEGNRVGRQLVFELHHPTADLPVVRHHRLDG
jgi:hypothetical protein